MLVTLAGGSLILLGCVLVVFPGPFTIPPILAGLALLGREYAWARRLQTSLKTRAGRTADRLRRR